MSRTEHIKGRLRKIDFDGYPSLTLKEKLQYVVNENQIASAYYCLDDDDLHIDTCTGFMAVGEEVYSIVNMIDLDPDGHISTVTTVPGTNNNEFDFECRFYNGGTYLEEMLENSFAKLEDVAQLPPACGPPSHKAVKVVPGPMSTLTKGLTVEERLTVLENMMGKVAVANLDLDWNPAPVVTLKGFKLDKDKL